MYEIRPILGFPNYSVSNTGDILSFAGLVPRRLTPTPARNGYLQVALHKNGKAKRFLVHRLVAEAFVLGHAETVDHIDNDKRNNLAENLRWSSRAKNTHRQKRDSLPMNVVQRDGRYQTHLRRNGKREWATHRTLESAISYLEDQNNDRS